MRSRSDVPTDGATARVQTGDDPFRIAFLGILVLAVALRLSLLSFHATEEDFYITLRYAENIAAGRGFVYNPGVHVLGTTTPLYTLLLALLLHLHLDPILLGKLCGIAADAGAIACVYRLGKVIGAPVAGLAAALCLAIAPTNLIWATKGMEVGLVAAAGVMAWMYWAERRETAAWIAAALLVLLRIDGVVLAVVLLGATLLRERRIPWRGLSVFLLLVTPWFLFATWYFGSPIPASLRAKLVFYAWHSTARFPNLKLFLLLMTHNPLGAFLVLGVVLYLSALVRSLSLDAESRTAFWSREGLLAAPGVWIGLHYGGMALSKVFLFGWYFVPPTPLYYLIALTGWAWGRQKAEGRGKREEGREGKRPMRGKKEEDNAWGKREEGREGKGQRQNNHVSVLCRHVFSSLFPLPSSLRFLLLSAFLCLAIVPRVAQTLREGQNVEETLRIPIGTWLRVHAAPAETVMLEPIGYIGYYSGLRVLDTVGLVSPEVLPYYTPQIPSPYHALWVQFRPDWILLRGGEWSDLQSYERNLPAAERLEAHYAQVHAWPESEANTGRLAAFTLFHRLH
jgi:hypothetical protein